MAINSRWILDNLGAFSLQVVLLVLIGGLGPAWLCRRWPRVRLIGGQMLLAACLLLPVLQPWNTAVERGAAVSLAPVAMTEPANSPAAPLPRPVPWAFVVLTALACGTFFRLACLAIRIGRLRRYRRESRPLEPTSPWSVEATLRVSDDVASPVTFGWRNPVVLLPPDFLSLRDAVQDAILCHEVLHVRRLDWLATVAEESVRALLWFHPAIWWLLSEIGLAREQEVDRQAIAITGERDQYMDALLAIASLARCEPAAATLFLRKGHFKRRMLSIAEDAPMRWVRVGPLLAAVLVLTAVAGWAGASAFPLTRQPRPAPYAITIEPAGAPVRMDGMQFGAIAVVGLPEETRRALLARLPVREGDPYNADAMRWVTRAVLRFNGRLDLRTRFLVLPDGGGRSALLEILAPGAGFTESVERIRVSDYLMTPNLLKRVQPVAPASGNASGVVLLNATIGTDGSVEALRAIRGPVLLLRPTIDAVKQWMYRPTVLNGRPVQVETLVEVVYPRK